VQISTGATVSCAPLLQWVKGTRYCGGEINRGFVIIEVKRCGPYIPFVPFVNKHEVTPTYTGLVVGSDLGSLLRKRNMKDGQRTPS